jgi:hypothetical protein
MRAVLLVMVVLILCAANARADPSPGCTREPSLEHAAKVDAYFRAHPRPDPAIDPAEVRDLAEIRTYIQRGRDALAAWRCDEPAMGSAQVKATEMMIPFYAAPLDQLEKATVEEAACRTTDACMAGRVCAYIADRAEALAVIAREKANPGGAVDLRLLHDQGRRVQDDEAAIARLKPQYRRARGKDFTEKQCAPAAR